MPEHRVHKMQVRLTTPERRWLEVQAAGNRQSISDYVRARLGVEDGVARQRGQQ